MNVPLFPIITSEKIYKDFIQKEHDESKSILDEQSELEIKFLDAEKLYLQSVENHTELGSLFSTPAYIHHAHYILNRLLKEDKQKFSFASKEQLKQLSLAFRYFNSKDDLAGLSNEERFFCLQLHETHRKCELENKIPPLSEYVDRNIFESMKMFKCLAKSAVRFVGIDALGQLLNIVAKDYTLTEEDFNRIFPRENLPAELITSLLASDIKLSLPVQQRLTRDRLQILEKQCEELHHNSQQQTIDQEAFSEVNAFVNYLAKTEEGVDGVDIDQEQLITQLIQQAEKSIPAVSNVELKAEQDLKQLTSKKAYLADAVMIGKEVGRAVHTWVRHTDRDAHHLKISSKVNQEFTACMQALCLDDQIQEYCYKSRAEITDLITKKLIHNHENAVEQNYLIAKEYALEVESTKKALQSCREQFSQLGAKQENLLQLGKLLRQHQNKVDRYHLKRSKLLKIGSAICDGIHIAGQIAATFAAPPVGLLALSASLSDLEGNSQGANGLHLAKHSLQALDCQNASQWKKSQQWYLHKTEHLLSGAASLHDGREALQQEFFALKQHRQKLCDYLIIHPQHFHSIAYRRLLLEELIEQNNGIETIQKRESECQVAMANNQLSLEKMAQEEQKICSKMESERLNRADSKRYKSLLSKLCDLRVTMCHKISENSQLQIESTQLQSAINAEQSTYHAIEGRLKHLQNEDSRPLHHRMEAASLSLQQQIIHSDKYLYQLQEELSQRAELPAGGNSDLNEKFYLEQIHNARLKQAEAYELLHTSSFKENVSHSYSSLLLNSIQRQQHLASLAEGECDDLQNLNLQEDEMLAKFNQAKGGLDARLALYEQSIQQEGVCKRALEQASKELNSLLPNREISFRVCHGAPKIKVNVNDYHDPAWGTAVDKNAKKLKMVNIAKAKELIASLPALQSQLEAAIQNKAVIQQAYQVASTEAERCEQEHLSKQELRINQATQRAERKHSSEGERELQKTVWQIALALPPDERIDFCYTYLSQLTNHQSPQLENVYRSQQLQCLQISRRAYCELWEGMDIKQRLQAFNAHLTAANQRQAAYDQMALDNHAKLETVEQQVNPDLNCIQALKAENQALLKQNEFEKHQIASLRISHNLAENIADLQAMSGESENPHLRALYQQHSDYLQQIGHAQPLKQWALLSHAVELVLREISMRFDRQSQHSVRLIPQFITQALEFSTALTYLWKASLAINKDSQAAIECGLEEPAFLQKLPFLPLLKEIIPIASFFYELPLAKKVGNYYLPALECIRTFVHLHNIFHSIRSGPIPTLQEQFAEFSREQKKLLGHYHQQIKEQLKENNELLHEVDQKIDELNQIICRGLQTTQESIQHTLLSQAKKHQTEICVQYSSHIKDKQAALRRDLEMWKYSEPEFELEAAEYAVSLGKIQHYADLTGSTQNNGFDIASSVDISDIAQMPKFFTGWLGAHLAKLGYQEFHHRMPSFPLLVATASSFVKIFTKLSQKYDDECPPNLQKLLLRQADDLQRQVKASLWLIAQQDAQIEKTAACLGEMTALSRKAFKEAREARYELLQACSTKAILSSRSQLKALVLDTTFFTQRFAITQNVIQLLTTPLPTAKDKLLKLLHRKKDRQSHPKAPTAMDVVAGAIIMLPLWPVLIPGIPLIATFGLMIDALRLAPQLSNAELEEQKRCQEFASEEPHPYSLAGRFGANQISQRLSEMSLIALAKLPPPAGVKFYYGEGERRGTCSFLLNGGSENCATFKELKIENVALTTSHWILDDAEDNIGHWSEYKVSRYMSFSDDGGAPLVEANVTCYFDQEGSRKANFTERSWVQLEDVAAIENLCKGVKSIDLLTISQKQAASIGKVYREFLEKEMTAESSSFEQWLGEYLLIPPANEGFPLALPKEFMDAIDCELKSELVDRHLGGLPTLMPFFEWNQSKALGIYSLEIVMKSHEKEAVECHRFRAFSIEKATVEVLQGKLECYDDEKQLHFENALLLYLIYGRFWKLGLPSAFSCKLVSGKAVLGIDEPFVGFYQQLKTNALQGTPLDWQTTDVGNSLRQRALLAAGDVDCRFRQNPLLDEYRSHYYLATSLAKLQNKIDPVKNCPADKAKEKLTADGDATLQLLFAESGLPWPETLALSDLLKRKSPHIDILKRELELLPHSAIASKLYDLNTKLTEAIAQFDK